jgi:hypothetical protein
MDTALLLAVRLSKEGYGSPQQILESPVRHVLAMLHYSNVLADAQETASEMNREAAS